MTTSIFPSPYGYVQETITEHFSTVIFPDFHDIALNCGSIKLTTHVLVENTRVGILILATPR